MDGMEGLWARVLTGLCGLLCSIAVPASVAAARPPEPEPRFVRFGAEHGLPTVINDLAVDREGYVWLATSDGVARYDGTAFRFWRRSPGRGDDTLPDNETSALAFDRDGDLWAVSVGGLARMDRTRRGFVRVRFDAAQTSCGREITAVAAAREGGVRIGTYAGAVCAIDRDGRVRRLSTAGAPLGASPTAMHQTRAGDWIVGTDAGLWRLRGAALERIGPPPLAEAFVFALTPDGGDRLWVGTDRGLFLLDGAGAVRPAPWRLPALANNAVVRRDAGGGYWIGTAAGLFRAASLAAPAVPVHGGRRVDSLSSGVFAMVLDREGGLWAAAYSQGLSYLPAGHARFAVIDEAEDLPLERADPVAAIASGDGGFWLVGSRRLYAVRAEDPRPRPVVDAQALGVDWLRTAARCPDGRLWLASYDRVFALDPRSGRAGRTLHYPDDGSRTPQTLLCDDRGRLWVSFFGGAVRVYDRAGALLHDLETADVLGDSAQDYAVLQPGPDGAPWLAERGALRRWDGRGFVRLALPAGETVGAFVATAPDAVWVARDGRLERYRWRDGRLTLLARSPDGALPAARVVGMLAAGPHLWLATVRGLVQYDTRSGRARGYGVHDGLPDIDFGLGAPVRAGDGPALALSKRGLVLFDPARPLPAPQAPMLAIETIELRREGETVSFDPAAVPATVTLRPGDRDLRVVARVMSFADPGAHRYRFRLLGDDADGWVQEVRGERVFSALAPGRYVLEIQGAGADGGWSATRRIGLTVEAPWWRRWWALLLYAFAASALIWWLAYLDRVRLRRSHNYQLIKQKRALAEQASQAKSRFLANLGHEVRTPMTGVLGMSELLLAAPLDEAQRERVRAIRRAGEHLLRLVNDALDLARIEAGRFELDSEAFALETLVEDVAALMRPLAERKGLRFVVAVAAEARGGWRGDPTRLRQILLNLLGNAIKFTERGEVSLSVEPLAPQGLRCSVVDTGPGLDAEQQRRLFRRFEQAEGARTASRYGGSGLGLAICQELAVAMGGGIELISAPGEGACFVVRLPLARAEPPRADEARPRARVEALQVLLVEDDPIVADVLTGLLQAQGHRATHAAHALAALTALAGRDFALALIDLDLPGMDGLALARLLRGQGFDRPMIAITARADADAEPQAMAAGFDAFLRKPLTGEMLANAIETRTTAMPPV